jgi:CHAD domain-containing protein
LPASFRFSVTDRLGVHEVAALLEPPWRAVVEEERVVVRRHLDTFDWAIWRSGGQLHSERDGAVERLCWWPGGDRPQRTLRVSQGVRFATELPAGILRQEVAAVAGERALLPVGEAEATRALVRVVNAAGKTVVRVWLETVRPLRLGAPEGPERRLLRVEPLTGYGKAGAEVAARLAAGLGLSPDERDGSADAVAAAGRSPGDYTSKLVVPLAPAEPAERAVRRVLARLLATLVANVEGAVQDVDTEFLHDLRVATRRTRTCLGQLRSVLPERTFAPFAEEFRWLGDVTTPCRDLDVFLHDIEARRHALPAWAAAALVPLVAHLREGRDAAHRALADALGSERFRALVRRWRRVLRRRAPGGEDGARPIADVAGESAVRAYRRLVRHGRALAPEPPATAMHRLRIDAKKLRYILEFFASLWDGEEAAALVRELKGVQDALGDLHDAWLQRERLLGLADELLAAGARAPTLLAMGTLAAELERRQKAEITAFSARFETFAAEATRARIVRLVSPRGGP